MPDRYEVHLCAGCIRDLANYYPYVYPREQLRVVEVSDAECDNTNLDDYDERLNLRNREFLQSLPDKMGR